MIVLKYPYYTYLFDFSDINDCMLLDINDASLHVLLFIVSFLKHILDFSSLTNYFLSLHNFQGKRGINYWSGEA